MKRGQRQLEWLFETARPGWAEPEVVEEMPAHLQTRILAHWRSARNGKVAGSSLALVFRGALLCAGAVTLLIVLWSHAELSRDPPESGVAIANYELQASLNP